MASSVHIWPRLINSVEDIPQNFLKFYQLVLGDANTFPYTIYLPDDRRSERSSKELMLSLSNDILFIFEKTKTQVQIISYKLEDIIYIKRGTMLLYSWIEILGYERNDLKRTMIEFNTVTKPVFQKLLTIMRSKLGKFEEISIDNSLSDELSKFDYLTTLDYKFMNYAREGIIANESVEAIILQPVIYRPYLRYFKKVLCSPHMHILTDKELIIIKEEDSSFKKYKTRRYLAVWTFVPLQKILNIAASKNEENEAFNLIITLPAEETLLSVFDESNEDEMRRLVERLC